MKAIVQTGVGSANSLQLHEVAKPTPADNEVLVKIVAATVTAGDVVLRKLPRALWLPMRLIMGLKRKTTPGHEFAGVVEGVGSDVTRFSPGDQVFGTTTGLSVGANAEFVCVPESWKSGVIAHKPSNLTFEEAAAVPVGGMTALYFLRRARVRPGQHVLVIGASGSVGTYAVQIARHFGAKVTGVCSSSNVNLVKSLGVDRVIDYTNEDFTVGKEIYDVVFDAVGKSSAARARSVLANDGRYVSIRSSSTELTDALLFIKSLIEAGAIKVIIDRCYQLEETSEAHRYVEAGHKKGNVVITLS